jgi:nucleoside-diphosphate-sugar epimerase
MYRLTGRLPLFLAKMVDFAFNSYAFSSDKAIEELGYSITPFDRALQRTIQYLREEVPA